MFRQKSKKGTLVSIEQARRIWEDAFGAHDDLLDEEQLVKQQWESTRVQLAGIKSRHDNDSRKGIDLGYNENKASCFQNASAESCLTHDRLLSCDS